MKKIYCRPKSSIFILFIFLLLFMSSGARAAESVFTIQTGSFKSQDDARNQFDSMIQKLSADNLDYLRIESIGDYYVVRLGKFEDFSEAEEFLKAYKSELSGAAVMRVYYIEKRIVEAYKKPTLIEPPEDIPEDQSDVVKDIIQKPLKAQIKMISDLASNEKYEEAFDISSAAIKVHPEDAKLIGWHGAVLFKMKRPAEAIKYFRKASELSPEVSDYHSAIGYCLFFLGRINDSIEKFKESLKLDGTNIDALAGLSVAYGKIGEKDKAMDVYNKLREIDTETADKILEILEK